MNRDDIRGVIVKCGEPFLFFFLWPIFFCRSDVIISLGGALSNGPGVSIEAKEVARRYCGVSFTFARTSDGIQPADGSRRVCEAFLGPWKCPESTYRNRLPLICLKTSMAGLLGSIFFAASTNASCSAFNCAMPISRIFCGGRSTNSVCARKRRNFSSPRAKSSEAFRSFSGFFNDVAVITERVCGFAIGCLKCDADLLVFETADSGGEIFFQKIGLNLWRFGLQARQTALEAFH